MYYRFGKEVINMIVNVDDIRNVITMYFGNFSQREMARITQIGKSTIGRLCLTIKNSMCSCETLTNMTDRKSVV